MEFGVTNRQLPGDEDKAPRQGERKKPDLEPCTTSLSQRVRGYLEASGCSQSALARLLGLPTRKLSYYLTEKSQDNLWPLLPLLLRHDSALSREWLYFGEGPMRRAPETGSADKGEGGASAPNTPSALSVESAAARAALPQATQGMGPRAVTPEKPLRLTGLGEGDADGWRRAVHTAAHVTAPRLGEGWLAVLAAGDSMLPCGIREGYTVFCDAQLAPAVGEAVYAELHDGLAGIKLFAGLDSLQRVVLEDWRPCGEDGAQAVRRLALDVHALRTLAPVIYVKHRL